MPSAASEVIVHLGQPAGHDPGERIEVVVDVDREAVRRHALGDVHAHGRDLALPTHTPTCLWPSFVPACRPASASAATSAFSIVRMYSGTLATRMIG